MKIRYYSFFVALLVAGGLLHFSAPASAQAISRVCSILLGGFSLTSTRLTMVNSDFYAGERVMFTATGGSGTLQIEVPSGTVVATGPSPVSYTFPSDFSGDVRFADSASLPANFTVVCFPVSALSGDSDDGPVAGPPCGAALDGRLNNSILLDCASPIALYTEGEDYVLYGIHPQTGEGTYLLRIAKADIGDTPAENTLLAESVNPGSGQPITVWHLSSGELQVNTTYADGKAYIFIFDTDGRLLAHYAA